MRTRLFYSVAVFSLLILLALTGGTGAAQAASSSAQHLRPVHLSASHLHTLMLANSAKPVKYRSLCSRASKGHARCESMISTTPAGVVGTVPAGWGPVDLQDAYALPSGVAGAGQTVAIVDAFDDPNAESDLANYRSTYGLSPCTSFNGCFRKVNQTGGTTYPPANAGWAGEISLDLDMVSAICPNCHILLVEANDNFLNNLGAAVDEAVALGATEVSNSYGGGEFSGEASDADYNHPGVPITVSTGDGSYSAGPSFPSSSPYVTAVGGTVLNITNGFWDETVWSGAQSGCSAFTSKPSWQQDSGCANRTTADVSAVATGVAVYDTYGTGGTWFVFAGTSVSAPIIASVYALAGNGTSISNASYTYSHTDSFFDIVSGNNGSCSGSYLCTAALGYDGPTGLGSPDGTSGF